MYATTEDREYLLGMGFIDGSTGFVRRVGDGHQVISPVWKGMKAGSLSPPQEDAVYWSVAFAGTHHDEWNVSLVVRFEDRQPTPTAAFVLAEVRGWKT